MIQIDVGQRNVAETELQKLLSMTNGTGLFVFLVNYREISILFDYSLGQFYFTFR